MVIEFVGVWLIEVSLSDVLTEEKNLIVDVDNDVNEYQLDVGRC